MDQLLPCCLFAAFVLVVIPALFALAYRWERAKLIKGDALASRAAPADWKRLALRTKMAELPFARDLEELSQRATAESLWSLEQDGIRAWAFRYQTGAAQHPGPLFLANCVVLELPDSWMKSSNVEELSYESKEEHLESRKLREVVSNQGQFIICQQVGALILLSHKGRRSLEELPNAMRDAASLIGLLRAKEGH